VKATSEQEGMQPNDFPKSYTEMVAGKRDGAGAATTIAQDEVGFCGIYCLSIPSLTLESLQTNR
jgi:hypothetical protein